MATRSVPAGATVTRLDAATARRWFRAAAADLAAVSDRLDALNVFPVADRDTGRNMLATWSAACDALPREAPGEGLADVLEPAARGALLGARGNSGAVLCQLLQGLADALPGRTADGAAVAAALGAAEDEARSALHAPVEGTIVTVARAAARAARHPAATGRPLEEVLAAADDAAREALAATTAQLPVLQAAGVVDAGASGFVVILAALRAVVAGGHDVPRIELGPPPADGALTLEGARDVEVEVSAADGTDACEVQFVLAAPTAAAEALRAALGELGDSVVVAGGPSLWQVHVHAREAGPVVEAGIRSGVLSRISITPLQDLGAQAPGAGRARTAGGRAVLALAPGPGLARLFEEAGATPVTFAERPGPEALRDAMLAAPVRDVIFLPNDAHLVADAQRAAREARGAGRDVVVVPTRSPVQGLAALAVADGEAGLADEVVAMADAAGVTRVGEVCVATLTAITMAGTCKPGDVLAMQGGDVVLVGRSLYEVGCRLLDRLLEAGGELVTLVVGLGASPELGSSLTAYLEKTHPFVAVAVYEGGQPNHPLLVGVE